MLLPNVLYNVRDIQEPQPHIEQTAEVQHVQQASNGHQHQNVIPNQGQASFQQGDNIQVSLSIPLAQNSPTVNASQHTSNPEQNPQNYGYIVEQPASNNNHQNQENIPPNNDNNNQ